MAAGPGPLAGYRVLDLGSILAGPYSGSLLADLGADVIKVEPPAGDSFRELGFTYNRGMRGLALDLSAAAGREAFYQLVRSADVVIDNYRPGVLGRLGADYGPLSEVNPRLVTMSITGFGEGGPLSDQPGFDPILQGMSGMMTAQGGDSDPVFHTIAVNDVTAAALAVLGVCLALHHRERTGQGQRVWTSLAGIAAFMQSGELVRFAGRRPPLQGGRDHRGTSALDRFYPVSDGWVRVQARDRDALGRLGLGDDEGALAGWLAGRSRDQAVIELTEAGIPAAAARGLTELPQDAELAAAQAIHLQHRADGSPFYTAGRYAMFSRTQHAAVLTPPGLGEHSRQVLTEAGLDGPAIDDLVSEKVVVEGGPMELTEFFAYR
jgi:crotonobetainyl-CoA:carnitine CoA-transferase CaiB-like acyl-CoA transferase